MSTYPNRKWVNRSNAETLYHLERQGRTGPGLVPFLGAGISTAFKFKDWKNLLLSGTPPHLASRVKRQLGKNDYEGAAETLLKEFGPDGFQNMVAASAGDSNLASFDFTVGTVSLLPLLANGPVITTNFDRILERAFEVNGAPFESVISGPRPDLIVDALHGNRRVLIKLHGDWQDRIGRTFTKSDYDNNYGEAHYNRTDGRLQVEQKRLLLAGAADLLFSSRSLLFIGASLAQDRTVAFLHKVHRRYAGIRHFAIMAMPQKERTFFKKEKDLRACGVLPLWYQADTGQQHSLEVERLIASIVERISVQTIEVPLLKAKRPTTAPALMRPSPRQTRRSTPHFDRMVRLIEDGRLTFFLGAAVHYPTNLMAAEFYQKLAQIFECEPLGDQRSAIAQYIADRHGRESLYGEVRKLLVRTSFRPRATHKLFAAWRGFRTHSGKRLPFPMVMTTNYDDVLERQLAKADLPYHLLSYQTDGAHRGLFYHRSPDNGLRIIEQPRNIRKFSDAFVVVKLNGGFDSEHRIPESYVTTRLDYWDLASRIPDALPAVVKQKLSANPLLFLGHGLAVPDVESLVRFAHKNHPGPRSWDVVLNKEDVEYWRQCGVEIRNQDVNRYVIELHERLANN